MRSIVTGIVVLLCASTFAQTENYWTRKADYAGLKRERAVAFTVGNMAYVGTGVDTSETVLKDFWAYEPINDVWTQIADLPGSERRNAVAFSIGDYGYVGTGMNKATSSEPGATKLSDFWQYDPGANSWTQVANFPGGGGNGVYFATSFTIDSKGYVCGGKLGPNWYTSQMWEYKASLDQWTQLPSFPGGVRYQMCSFSVGINGYVGCGTDQDVYRNDFYKFSAATNQWTQISDLPASERSGAATFSIGSKGYVCMGTNGGFLDDLWEYDPASDDWEVRATYGGSPRKNSVGFSLYGMGYVGTGKGYSGKKQSIHQYHPYGFLGVDENELSWNVYPNPTTDFVNIKSDSDLIDRIELLTATGELISSTDASGTLSLIDQPIGIYFLRAIGSENNVLSNKQIIKQ